MESLALNFSYEGFFFSYLFDNAGIGVPGGEQYILIDSGKLFVVIYPVDEKYYYNSLHSYIERIRNKEKYAEIIIIWNAYNLSGERTISYKEEKKMNEEEKIKFSYEIEKKKEIEILFKKIANICLILYKEEIESKYGEKQTIVLNYSSEDKKKKICI